MKLETKRLILRPWVESDAKSLYKYAKDPRVGPIAGWLAHTSQEDSLRVIKNVLSLPETYAICLKENNIAIGSIGLKDCDSSYIECLDTEREIGYWIGVPFWGQGYVPEAVGRIQQHAFEDLKITALWCGYYNGNIKSKRVQEKCGFIYHHTQDSYCELLNEDRITHVSYLTREQWENNN